MSTHEGNDGPVNPVVPDQDTEPNRGPDGTNGKTAEASGVKNRSVLGVIVHSFFVVPFLIAMLGVLLYAGVRILTIEHATVYDYLNDIKAGGATKRWQAAFELSKVLADPERIPAGDKFVREMTAAFDHAQHDDNRVRQYLALAMGQTGNSQFIEPIAASLPDEPQENLYSLIYSLGLFRDARVFPIVVSYLEHEYWRARDAAAVALGVIGDREGIGPLEKALRDSEPNVRWDAAVALAKLGSSAGSDVLLDLLHRDYFAEYPNVDDREQSGILTVVIQVAAPLNDPDIDARIRYLSREDRDLRVRRAAHEALR